METTFDTVNVKNEIADVQVQMGAARRDDLTLDDGDLLIRNGRVRRVTTH